MISIPKRYQNLLAVIVLIVVCFYILNALWGIVSTTEMGGGDFWGYWSSAYLLHHGQNPYDPESMARVQATQMQTGRDFTIMSWNPPTLFLIILPFSHFPIKIASFLWLITNLLLIASMAFMLINLYLHQDSTVINLGFLLFAFAMPQILTSIYAGQITILVSFGLVACMTFLKKEKWFLAGAILILTTVKPHLVVLQVIYIFVYMAYKKKFRGWAGIVFTGLTFLSILLIFRPQLINDLIGLSQIAPNQWLTPTIGGLLSFLGITELGRYLIVLLLPIPFLLARQHEKIGMEFSIAVLTLLTVPFTFFGWGYDQAILLIPIAQVVRWLYQMPSSPMKYLISILIFSGLCVHYYQKYLVINEVYYVWVPLFWCLIFSLTYYKHTHSQLKSEI